MSDARRREFFQALDAKLDQGAREYGAVSFARPAPELLDELEAEALDIAGWGYILWTRIRRLRSMAGDAERRADRG